MRLKSLSSVLALCLAAGLAVAAEPEQAIRQSLSSLQLDVPIESISPSPLAGLYQVQLKGGRILYASADGKHLVQGYLFEVGNGRSVNLTEQAESVAVASEINTIPADKMVVFPAKSAKSHITVFTDTDCGYCQKLHTEVPELNRQGIEVRYVAFPRQGLSGKAYDDLVSVWCSKDRQAAMNLAKARKAVPKATCDNPIAEQYELGQMIGVQGTPAIVLPDGKIIPGYQPADRLVQQALQAKRS